MKWRALLALLLSPVVASAGLLEVKLTRPLITFQNTSASALTYTTTNQLFAVNASPTAVQFSSAETPSLVTGTKNLGIRALVDNLGNLVGGVAGDDFTLSGTVTRIVGGVTNTYSGVLLTGEIAGFGYLESGTSDRYDFRFTVTGGLLSNFFSSGDIGVQVTSAASTFTGVFSASFNGRAAGNTGLETCPVSILEWGYVVYPTPAGLTGVVAVAGSVHHTLALKSDGTVVGWGDNYYGETVPPADLTNAVAIAAGAYHSLALKSDSTVVGWGYNGNGEATPPAGLTGVVAIDAGNFHGLALKSDGTVVGWGYNYYGEATTPAGLTGVVAIAAGAYHSLALKSDGTVVGWGDTGNGAATPPVDLTNIEAIAAGNYHSLALKSDGTVVGWGNDGSGQATTPTNLTGVAAIAAGVYHSLALKSDGTVVGWGANGSGQATPPAGLVGVVAITAGGDHSLALTIAAASPSLLSATIVATNQVNLSWVDNSLTEDSFKIERALDDGGNPGTWAQIATVNANVTNYSDVGVTADATYWYRVRATSSACGDSLYSFQAVVSLVPPGAPFSLTAYGVATNQVEVDLFWYAASGTEAGYRIERAPDDNGNPGMWAEIGTVVGGTNTFYIDAGVSPNTPYWYRVRAYNVFGDSPYSNPTVVSVLPPSNPVYPYAYAASANQAAVDLYWYDYYNNSGNVTGYKIERAPDANGSPGTWAEIAVVTNGYSYSSFYRDTGLMPNTTYWYRVHAYNVVGNAPDSSPLSVSVGPPPYPVYPYAYAASANQAAVDLYWYDYYNNSGNVTGYKIERAPDINGSPGTWTQTAAVTNGYSYSSFYRDTGVMANAKYWYRVRAYNMVGDAPDSSPLSWTVGPPSNAPYSISAYAVPTNVEVDVYWYDYYNNSGDVAGYKLERAPDVSGSPGTWTQIAATTNGFSSYSFFSDTGVLANAKYWYRVRAYNVVGDSPYSYSVSVSLVPPAAPYYINASTVPASLQVNVYWYEADSNVAGYKIERAPDDNGIPGTWMQIATNVGYNNSFSDTTVEANNTYWYRVRAYNVVGDSPYSPLVTVSVVPPPAPSYLNAYIVASEQIRLNWSYGSGTEAGYKLERAPDNGGNPGAWTEIATVPGYDNTYYYDSGVMSNATYWYRVRAYNAAGNSPYAGPVFVSLTPPPAPSPPTAISDCPGYANLVWVNTNSTVSGFKIERAPDAGGSAGAWAQIADIGATTTNYYTDTGLTPGGTYWYRLRAYNALGDSPYSNAISVTNPVTATVDYFTELFDTKINDLDNQMFTFTPDGPPSYYSVCRDVIGALPTDPGGGTTLPLSDDSYSQVTLNNGAQISLYGTSYSTLFVGSNGYITFGSGDSTYPESFSTHFNRPRISALFDDLYPGSNISWRQLPDRVAVTWLNIAEYGTGDQNTFQIELFFDGRIRISYLAIAATDGLAGLSRGTGVPNCVGSDFSSYASCTPTPPSAPTDLIASSVAHQVNLSWRDTSLNEDGFKVERAPDASGAPGSWAEIAIVATNATSYTDAGIATNTIYWYRVRAYNLLGDSPYSNEASVLVRGGQLVRVMQWNTEHGLGRQSNNSGSAAQALARVINYNRPDVLLFNEIDAQNLTLADNQAALIDWVNNWVPYLAAQTFYVAVSTQTDGFNRNAAISRYPILSEGTYNDGLRGLHSFQVQLSGTNVLQVFHTHIKCCSDDCTRKHFEAQFDASTISAWAATNAIPYIFAGDWNDDEQSPLCAPPNTITTIREGGGLVEFKPTTLDGEYRTWSTSSASIRFDYILAATNRLAPLSGYVFSTMNWASHGLYTNAHPANLVNDSQIASDHYCVFADYFFRDGAVTPGPSSIILDDLFPYGTRFLQYLPTSSAWWSSSVGSLTAEPGTMALTVGGSSIMAITYFTPDSSSPPVQLNVGDTLTATFKFMFNGIPTAASSSQGFRIGLFNFADSTLNPRRVSADGFTSSSQGDGVQGYALFEKMYATFSDNQPMDLRKRTNMQGASLLGTSADWTTLVKNHFDTSQFPGFANLTPYSLQFILHRTGLNSLVITVTWSNMTTGATLSQSTTDNSATNFSFDGIAYRPQNNTQAPAINQFREVKIELTSAPVAPSIVTQPQDLTVPSGLNATFTVVPNGTLPLFYQWYYNTVTSLANSTNFNLTLNNVQPPDEGGYSIIVSNAYGSVTSVVAQLTVLQSPPTIVTQPQGLTVIPGQSALFSVVAIGNEPLSYQWYYNSNTPLTNATADTFTLASVQPSDAGSYFVTVSNSIGSVTSSNAVLTVNTGPVGPVFITQPVSLSVWPGDSASLTAVAVGTQSITYQWKKNDSSIANATNTTYTITNARASDYGTYSVIAANNIGSVTSSNATVTVFQPAFPGAEGFGALVTGGRSGTVYHVTNLSNAGSGSFRDAVSSANRTVVFDVSGTIDLFSDLSIISSNLTIAGQTAPGDGITLRGRLTEVKNTRNVIVRFIRCRPGDISCPNFQDDSFHVVNSSNVVVDHVSASWSIDEVLSVAGSTGVSIQWSVIAESLENSCHLTESGSCCEHHGYGSLLRYGAGGLSFHHNLYAHNGSRNPRLGDDLDLDFVNNVIYNWGGTAGYSGEASEGIPQMNYVNNYVIVGPSSGSAPFYAFEGGSANTQIYQSGNLMDTNVNGFLDGTNLEWNAFKTPYAQITSHFGFPLVRTNNAATAYVRVLSSVGASVVRDAVDSRIISNVISQNTGAIIDSQYQVGGWPALSSLPAPTDTDQDGMPDFWERALGLNRNDPSDRDGLTPDGYTRLEDYLNWLAGPHARVQSNSFVNVAMQEYTAGLQNPTYGIFSASNGVVILLGDGHTAQFTPAPGFSGLASFLFAAADANASLTGTVSVLVTPANLVWRGDGTANNWNVAAAANWLDGTNVVTFSPGDNVRFTDTGSNSPPVNLVGTLLPSSVIVAAAQNYTFNGTGSLGGVMSLVKSGTGRLVMTTSNTFSGGTIVSNGTLLVNNTAGSGTGIGAVTVVSGATLGGSGIISGPVTVDGTLAPGNSAGTLTISNNAVVGGGAVLRYELGTNSDRIAVSGDLALGGTLNITDTGGFGPGMYTLFTFSGVLSYTGVTIGTTPSPSYLYLIDTNNAGQVRLIVLPAGTINMTAADLQDGSGNLMATSSVAVLVADTANTGFVDPQSADLLALGATWGSANKIVGLWDLRDSFACAGQPGAVCTQTVVTYTDGIAPGQKVQLYWFPSLTLASNIVGVTHYGKYTDQVGLGGSDIWKTPTVGSVVNLLFITADEGGSAPQTAGRATFLTTVSLTAFQNWQIQHLVSTNNPLAAPDADPDGDGQNNMAEFLAGTSPTNTASAFRITAIAQEGSDIRVTWTTGTGKTNSLQAGDTDFADIFTVTNIVDSVTNYLDAGAATNAPSRFYRIRLVP